MILLGLSWLAFWLLINPLNVAVDVAALIVGIGCIVLAFLLGDTALPRRNP